MRWVAGSEGDTFALGDKETLRRETLQYVFGSPPLPPVLPDEHQLASHYFGVTRTCEAVVPGYVRLPPPKSHAPNRPNCV